MLLARLQKIIIYALYGLSLPLLVETFLEPRPTSALVFQGGVLLACRSRADRICTKLRHAGQLGATRREPSPHDLVAAFPCVIGGMPGVLWTIPAAA